MATPSAVGDYGRGFGAFDVKGEWVIPLQKDYDEAFRLARAYKAPENYIFAERDESAWGFMNQKLEWIISPQYEYAADFQNGLAAVKKNGACGLITNSNEVAVPFDYEVIRILQNGMARVRKNRQWGLIDTEGNILIEPEFDYLEVYEAGLPYLAVKNSLGKIVSWDKEVLYELTENQIWVPFKNGIAFIYTPVGEIDYEKGLQKFKVFVIDVNGNRIFKEDFTEQVKIYMI
ncbi:MAG: WG repeat-containing protein [Spirochaetales bacterium]|uniref:WG repeat-containing protein n=1 Tax=Candidatus Thalassospirochaeta sargassi TaxID=3119039 RepID=A0AAJ1IHD7_9SPIO|nr:WG repeat-containing protein [Spirochaetales bacterium]